MEEKRLQLLELKRQQLEARKQQDPALEKMINETKEKVAAYSKRVEANRPVKPAEVAAKDAGLIRMGVKKLVNDQEVVARV